MARAACLISKQIMIRYRILRDVAISDSAKDENTTLCPYSCFPNEHDLYTSSSITENNDYCTDQISKAS